MTIDWTHFTPWASLAGGLLIGVSAAFFILFSGRILGISGIVGGLLKPPTKDWGWRLAFLLGLFVSPWVWSVLIGPVKATINTSTPVLILAGLLVGLGTRYGSGCTSGHGVCGLSRLSPRSVVATLSFMTTGFLTVYVVRHLSA
ncbi:MAG TPA: YeeE/YedE [Pusillimonas sp.]|jgi:uncharacterized membrane protein YedE/YeeE|nr:YeeE/YedE [Pusillimonas sp.]|tara:strand:+ start:56813 stop:57244 length:432 start_codon:yes stop_codon:yes gene_type:complete